MKAILLALIASVLVACTPAAPLWTSADAQLYRVITDSAAATPDQGASGRSYFLVRRVAGLAKVAADAVQYQVYWCQAPGRCTERDFALELSDPLPGAEGERVSFEAGAACTIVRHVVAAERITLQVDTFAAADFLHEECAAGVSAPLPAKFVRISGRTVTAQAISHGGEKE